MTQEQIIQMARDAGFSKKQAEMYFPEMLGRFADLVAAHEREECAKVCDGLALSSVYQTQRRLADYASKSIRARGNA